MNVDQIYKKIINKSGLRSRSQLTKAELWLYCRWIDQNKDGSISVEELEDALISNDFIYETGYRKATQDIYMHMY